MILKQVDKITAAEFIAERHYSAVMPRLTKYFLGCFEDNELIGIITFGWGTRPKHTIQALFPELDTKDYYEIGKMCMDDKMLRNSESQLLSLIIKWCKENTDIKYLFTWADGIVGKVGYVYQASNFLYGGFSWTDLYVTEKGEKVHPRTIQGQLPNEEGLKYGHRPNFEQRIELGLKRVFGKQFRYIYPMTKKDRKYLKNSTVEWSLNHPKDDSLEWKVLEPNSKDWVFTSDIPFKYDGTQTEFNESNVSKVESKYGRGSLEGFL